MKSSTAAALGLSLALGIAALPLAQAQTPGSLSPSETSDPSANVASEQIYAPFRNGDQTLSLAAGVSIPLFISVPAQRSSSSASTLYAGGLFSFSYQYFLMGGFAIGGTIDGAFNGVIDGSSLFLAPLTFRQAYWWSFGSFEVCTAIEEGAYLWSLDYSGTSYVGVDPVAKAGGGIYWRVSQGWSVGLQSYFWFLPEIKTSGNTSLDAYTGMLEVSIGAFYHL